MNYPMPLREQERLAVLDSYKVLDTPPVAALDRITRMVAAMLGVPIALISLVDQDRQWFKSKIGLDVSQTPRDLAFCAHAICQNAVMVVPDARDDLRFSRNPLVMSEPSIRFYAGAPLRTPDGHNIGTLCAIGQEPRTLSPEQKQLLTDMAAMVMEELEYRRAGKQALGALSEQISRGDALYELAMTDPLTGALNRRAFLDLAEKECLRAIRRGTPLSLLAFDIDHFKRINDQFGHAAGDDVLRALVRHLNGTIRADEILGRIGGEEFAIMLPEADAHGAHRVAERVRAQLATLCPIVVDGGATITFTVSIGVTECFPARESLDEVFKRADAAMYQAKAAGRDRVVSELAA